MKRKKEREGEEERKEKKRFRIQLRRPEMYRYSIFVLYIVRGATRSRVSI